MPAQSLAPLAAVLLLAASCGERKPVASPAEEKPPTLSAATGLSAPPALTPEEQAGWTKDILAALQTNDAKAIAEIWDTRGDTEIAPELAARIHEAIKTDFPDQALEVTLYLDIPHTDAYSALSELFYKDSGRAERVMLGFRSPLLKRREYLARKLASHLASDDFTRATAFALHFTDVGSYDFLVSSTVMNGLSHYQTSQLPGLVAGILELEESSNDSGAKEILKPWSNHALFEATQNAAKALDYEVLDQLLALRPDIRDTLLPDIIARIDDNDFPKAQEYAQSITDSEIRKQAIFDLGWILARDAPEKSVAWTESLPNSDDRIDAYQGMTHNLSFKTPDALTTFVRSIPTVENRRLFAKEYADFLDKAALPDGATWKAALAVP